jgi:hypothetical protein
MTAIMSDTDRVVAHIRSKLTDLNAPQSNPAYEYSSLGLCVIDAVFSIGAHYTSTENAVEPAGHMRSPVSRGAIGECNAITCWKLGHSELTFDSTLETGFRRCPIPPSQ